MNMTDFSSWTKWSERNTLDGLQYPGVYAIAKSSKDISRNPFSLKKEIVYFGMTNSQKGLGNRLKQFDNTIQGKIGHGGAQRFLFKYREYDRLIKELYVAVNFVECEVDACGYEDLLKMGEVVKFEYVCLAEHKKMFNCLPEFNDKKKSPKAKR